MKNLKNILKTTYWLHLIIILGFCSTRDLFSMRMTEKGKLKTKRFFEEQKEENKIKKFFEEQEKDRKSITRNLLIFLDDSEKKFDAVGGIFLNGLYQEISPIIVSTSLLYVLHEERKKDAKHIETLLNQLEFMSIHELAAPTEKIDIVTSKIGFRSDRWIIKKINDSLVLLIPEVYLELLAIDDKKVREYNENLLVESEVELQLGLKVNHMKTITIEEISEPKANTSQFSDYFVKAMDFIFCTKLDYKIANMKNPEWVIFINGHGKINISIANLSLNGFKGFLNFLENKIKTQLLMYSSCFSIGVNSDKIFGNIKSQVRNYYSFPIIAQGVRDAAVIMKSPEADVMLWHKKKEIGLLHIDIDFFSFFKIAEEVVKGNYKGLMHNRFLHNIAQIKLPGLEWFSTDIVDKKIVSIGSILSKTHDPQKPLDVVSFFRKDPEIILLYTDDIPFELVINSNKVKAICSMALGSLSGLPESVIHRIKKISSTQGFLEILSWFALVGQSGGKIFLIDEIGNNKDILISGADKGATVFYYKDHNKDLLVAKIESLRENVQIVFNKVESGSKEEEEYQNGMHIARVKYPNIKSKIEEEMTLEQIKKIENVLVKKGEKQMQEAQK